MSSSIKFDYLKNRLDALPVIAKWQHDQWGHLHPEQTFDDRMKKVEQWTNQYCIPTAIVAYNPMGVLGSASLVEYDLDTHKELSPWLAAVIVHPKYRRQGVGTAMVRRIIDEAKLLKINKIYLYTFDKQLFYTRLGWELIMYDFYHEDQIAIMGRLIE